MRSRPRSMIVRLGCILVAFCAGCLFTHSLWSRDTRTWCKPLPATAASSAAASSYTTPLLLVLIISAPGNLERRNAIRQTWLPLGKQIVAPLPRDQLAAGITVPAFNSAGFTVPETVDQQADNLRLQRDALPRGPRMRRPEHFVPVGIRHRFVIATGGLLRSQLNQLAFEQSEHGDLLQLDGLVDNYANLTRKLLHTFDAIVYGAGRGTLSGYPYVLKCDDDTYVKLDRLAAELLVFDEQKKQAPTSADALPSELYWGYFSANAHVKGTGKWREENYVLADRYHPYALGGGYVVSQGIVQWLAANAALLVQFVSEDVSMGLWLSAMRTVYRRHDVRFDTGWMARQCRDYHLVLHKRSIRDMKMIRGGGICSGIEDDNGAGRTVNRPPEYFYNWSGPVLQCCGRFVGG